MEALFHSLLMLMLVVCSVAVVMRKLGLSTIFVGLTMTVTAVVVTLKACVPLLKKHHTH